MRSDQARQTARSPRRIQVVARKYLTLCAEARRQLDAGLAINRADRKILPPMTKHPMPSTIADELLG